MAHAENGAFKLLTIKYNAGILLEVINVACDRKTTADVKPTNQQPNLSHVPLYQRQVPKVATEQTVKVQVVEIVRFKAWSCISEVFISQAIL